jgi:hypothetical protein
MTRLWRLFVDSRSLAVAVLCAVVGAAAAARLGLPRGVAAVLMAAGLGLALVASVMVNVRPKPGASP